jgi:hypothetical protein
MALRFSIRARTRASMCLAILYVISVVSFWLVAIAAFAQGFSGPARFLGILYLPALLLPVIGRGSVAGIAVHSQIWLWWFACQFALALAAATISPRERRRHPAPRVPSPARRGAPAQLAR